MWSIIIQLAISITVKKKRFIVFDYKEQLKGAVDNFSLNPPIFFKKVEIFIPLEVYTYEVTACLILLATST